MKQHRMVRWLGLAVIVTLAAAGLLLATPWAQAAPPAATEGETRTVTVTGMGQVSIQPDQATITVGVQTDADSAAQALSQNSQQTQAVLSALTQAGIAQQDIQTQAVQVQPRYNQPSQPGGSQTVSGYTAMNLVSVRVRNLDNLGQLIDTAVQAGANQVQNIQFQISDPAQALEQARAAAWQDAEGKATQLAGLAGSGLGAVLQVSETGASPQPLPQVASAMAGAAVPIVPGTQSVQTTLQVTWALSGEAAPGGTATPATGTPASTVTAVPGATGTPPSEATGMPSSPTPTLAPASAVTATPTPTQAAASAGFAVSAGQR